MAALGLVTSLLSAVAPKFLKNLRRNDISDQFADKVVKYVKTNIAPMKTDADVQAVIKKIEEDNLAAQRFFDALLDAERELIELHISDVQHARETNRRIDKSWQPVILLSASFVLLILISGALLWMVVNPPDLAKQDVNRDLVIQVSGAVIGFLTGIGGMFARNIGSAFDFWFGSSAGSKTKSDQIETIIQKIDQPGVGGSRGEGGAETRGGEPEPTDELAALRSAFRARMAEDPAT